MESEFSASQEACTQDPSSEKDADVVLEFCAGASAQGLPLTDHVRITQDSLAMAGSTAEALVRAIGDQKVPEACLSDLRWALRASRALRTAEGRCGLVTVRLLALAALLQASAASGPGSFQHPLYAYPGLLTELVDLLWQLPELDLAVAEALTSL